MLEIFWFTSTSRLRATSVKFSCCSRVLSILSSVMQKQRSLASMGSRVFAKMTNLAIYGTQIISLYSWEAKLTDSWTCLQSISQNLKEIKILISEISVQKNLGRSHLVPHLKIVYLADTFVVKETHWLTNVSGVEPVISSHWAGVVPPETKSHYFSQLFICSLFIHISVILTCNTTKQT